MNEIEFEMTCGACPEQYDAFYNSYGVDGTPTRRLVGYLRLRHGFFRVDCPDCGGKTVFEGEPIGDGIFDSEERDEWLGKAAEAINKWMIDQNITGQSDLGYIVL